VKLLGPVAATPYWVPGASLRTRHQSAHYKSRLGDLTYAANATPINLSPRQELDDPTHQMP
jgi:hypothetical protein